MIARPVGALRALASIASLLGLALFSAVSAPAAEYFVATNGVNGAARTGATDQPFATVAYAVTRATQPGDIVTVRAGTYRGGEAKFQADGAPGNPITLRGEPGAEVILKGSLVVTGWTLHSGSIYRASWTYNYGSYDARYLDDDPANDPPYRGAKRRNQFFADGQILEEVGRMDWLKPGSFYIDPVADYVYVWLVGGANPSTKLMEGSHQQNPLVASWGKSHLVIRNLRLMHLANNVSEGAALRISAPYGGSTGPDSSYVTIENVSVTWTHGSGLSIRGPYHVVRDSEFNDNGHNGLHINGADYGLFQNLKNLRNNTHPGKTFDTGWEASMKVAGGTNHTVFDGLESAYNVGQGFWIDGPKNHYNTLKNSRVHHNTHQGVRIEIACTTTLVNNLVHHNGESGININASIGNLVLNNTLYGNGDAGIFVGDSRTWAPENGGYQMNSYGNVILNNIVADNQQADQYKKSFIVARSVTNVSANLPPDAVQLPYADNISDHNLFHLSAAHPHRNATTNPDFFTLGGSTPYFHVYQAQNGGLDANSLYVDPLFVDAAAGDFRLRPESRARKLGSSAALPDAAVDITGVAREAGRIDLGAHQHPLGSGWTAVAAAADTYVASSSTTTNYGAVVDLLPESKGGPTYRKVYLRFPVATVAADALLEITTKDWSTTEVVPFRLYGLVNGHAGDTAWTDASLTYANAPANLSGAYFDSGAVLIDSFTVRLAATGSSTNSVIRLQSQALADFINQNTNGQITLMLVREPSSTAYPYNYNANTRFHSRESSAGAFAPRLLTSSATDFPVADAGVRHGSPYSTQNFGTSPVVEVKYAAAGSGYLRQGFLRFDVSGETAPSARLEFVVRWIESGISAATPATIELRQVASDSWTETGVTAQTAPAIGALIGSAQVTHQGQIISFNLGGLVQSTGQGDGLLSLALTQPSGGNIRLVGVHSKENGQPAVRPTLVFP